MPPVVYYVIHIISLFVLAGLAYGMVHSKQPKPYKIGYGIASFFVLLGGFGLMAKIGYGFADNPWLTIKLLIWIGLAVVIPALVKRKKLSMNITVLMSVLLGLAVLMVYIRPF